MIIYESNFQRFWFDEEKQLVREKYLPESATYNEETFKADHLAINDAVGKHLPNMPDCLYFLLDMSHFRFIMTPALQKWHKQNIYPEIVKANVKAVGLIASSSLFFFSSTFDTLKNKPRNGFRLRRFKKVADAEAWLMEKRNRGH